MSLVPGREALGLIRKPAISPHRLRWQLVTLGVREELPVHHLASVRLATGHHSDPQRLAQIIARLKPKAKLWLPPLRRQAVLRQVLNRDQMKLLKAQRARVHHYGL